MKLLLSATKFRGARMQCMFTKMYHDATIRHRVHYVDVP